VDDPSQCQQGLVDGARLLGSVVHGAGPAHALTASQVHQGQLARLSQPSHGSPTHMRLHSSMQRWQLHVLPWREQEGGLYLSHGSLCVGSMCKFCPGASRRRGDVSVPR
jgi:hypothetical protein